MGDLVALQTWMSSQTCQVSLPIFPPSDLRKLTRSDVVGWFCLILLVFPGMADAAAGRNSEAVTRNAVRKAPEDDNRRAAPNVGGHRSQQQQQQQQQQQHHFLRPSSPSGNAATTYSVRINKVL